jgi:hypothetical protein
MLGTEDQDVPDVGGRGLLAGEDQEIVGDARRCAQGAKLFGPPQVMVVRDDHAVQFSSMDAPDQVDGADMAASGVLAGVGMGLKQHLQRSMSFTVRL